MKKITYIILFILAFVAIVGVVFIVSDMYHPPNYTEDEMEGYWYQIHYEGYRDGEYVTTENENADVKDFGIQIDKCRDGVFVGSFNYSPVVGTYVDGVLKFYGTYGELVNYSTGFVIGDLLYLSVTEVNYGVPNTFFNIYSKNPYILSPDLKAPNIVGDWKAYESFMLNGTERVDLNSKNVEITSQDGMVFKGTQEQIIGDEVVTLDIRGAFFYDGREDYWTAVFYVNGENWMMYSDGNFLSMFATMSSVVSGSEGETVSVCSKYTHNGSAINDEVKNFEEKEWISDEQTTGESNEDSIKITSVLSEMKLKVVYQNENLVYLKDNSSRSETYLIGFIMGDDIVLSTAKSEVPQYISGKIVKDEIVLSSWVMGDNIKSTMMSVFKEI